MLSGMKKGAIGVVQDTFVVGVGDGADIRVPGNAGRKET